MDEAMNVGIEQEIIAELTIELQEQPTFSAEVLAIKVRNAIREVKLRRNYTVTSYTDLDIEKDLYNYYSVIREVAMYDYAHIGANGEISHSENSVGRSWHDRDDLFRTVHPFVKVL